MISSNKTVQLLNCAKKVVSQFSSKLNLQNQYPIQNDLAIYFKHPMMYLLAGNEKNANRILDHIKVTFYCDDGNFLSDKVSNKKSNNDAYEEFSTYINGWIVRAAQLLKRKDISDTGLKYLLASQDSISGGFLTHFPREKDGITDVISTAHLGLVFLESNNLEVAKQAGNYLCEAFEAQSSNIKSVFYLRRDKNGNAITEFPSEAKAIFEINKKESGQLYFMVAYPIAFLARLYKEVKDIQFLEYAKKYAGFCLGCHEDVYTSEFSHKLAWGLSELHCIEENEVYHNAIVRITNSFLNMQNDSGLWFENEPLKSFDQSAEIACWFFEVSNKII